MPAPEPTSATNRPADLAPDELLAAAFGKQVTRWAREQDAPPAAAELAGRAATQVSQAVSDGHGCLGTGELLANLERAGVPRLDMNALRARLLESRVVGTPAAPAALPLILDQERLYLHRYFDYECRLAANLLARSQAHPGASVADDLEPSSLPATVLALLDQLFGANTPGPATPDWQRIAVLTALLGRLTVISGGPGTGKTTAVVNLLACLLEADPGCRIALTAPTGKAAARMTEIIRQRALHLPAHLRAKLPTEAATIHRLLGGTPDGEFRHHAGNQLPIDVLIVDEASMLDLALAVHLIEAVPQSARIILLGDKDQLAAVESGAVFSELSAQPCFSQERIRTLSRLCGITPQRLEAPQRAPSSPVSTSTPRPDSSRLDDCVIWLRRNYRFAAGSAIGMLATDINDGAADRVLGRLHDAADATLAWVEDGGSVPSRKSVAATLHGYAPYLEALRSHAAAPRDVTAAFADFRVLCAVRDGPWGVRAINQLIGTHFRRTLRHPLDPGLRSEWYPGRPVMVLRNDPVLQLFNGDVGIVWPDADHTLQVWFPAGADEFRAVAPVRLPDHETAFAMTVHKSQGSEFEEILLVLPAEPNRILTRELLYTAVTRARKRLSIVASAAVAAHAVATATQRVSGLMARMQSRP